MCICIGWENFEISFSTHFRAKALAVKSKCKIPFFKINSFFKSEICKYNPYKNLLKLYYKNAL